MTGDAISKTTKRKAPGTQQLSGGIKRVKGGKVILPPNTGGKEAKEAEATTSKKSKINRNTTKTTNEEHKKRITQSKATKVPKINNSDSAIVERIKKEKLKKITTRYGPRVTPDGARRCAIILPPLAAAMLRANPELSLREVGCVFRWANANPKNLVICNNCNKWNRINSKFCLFCQVVLEEIEELKSPENK